MGTLQRKNVLLKMCLNLGEERCSFIFKIAKFYKKTLYLQGNVCLPNDRRFLKIVK